MMAYMCADVATPATSEAIDSSTMLTTSSIRLLLLFEIVIPVNAKLKTDNPTVGLADNIAAGMSIAITSDTAMCLRRAPHRNASDRRQYRLIVRCTALSCTI